MNKIYKIIKNTVLGMIILFSLAVITTSFNILGSRQFVDVSGSMEPKIKTGSFVIDRPQNSYKTGDIITFRVAGSRDTVTHRIVQVKKDVDGNIFYVVKGDANAAPDANPVPKENVVGKVSFAVPYIGYLVRYLKTLPGLIIFIIIPATILIYNELTNISTEISNIRAAKRRLAAEARKLEESLEDEEKKLAAKVVGGKNPRHENSRPVRPIIGLLLITVAVCASMGATASYFTDTASLTGLTIKTTYYPTSEDNCKDGGWMTYSGMDFKNQGECVSWVEHNLLGNGTPADNKPGN